MEWLASWYFYACSFTDMIPSRIETFDSHKEHHDIVVVPFVYRVLGLWKRYIPKHFDACHVHYTYNNRGYRYIIEEGQVVSQWPPCTRKQLNSPLGFHENNVVIHAVTVGANGTSRDVLGDIQEFQGPLHDFHGKAWELSSMFPEAVLLIVCTLGGRHIFVRGQRVCI